jgi:hypothetical protein
MRVASACIAFCIVSSMIQCTMIEAREQEKTPLTFVYGVLQYYKTKKDLTTTVFVCCQDNSTNKSSHDES